MCVSVCVCERERERERELFKEFKDFSNLHCNRFIKNKKIKNLLHTRAKARLPPYKHLKPVFGEKIHKIYTKNIIKFFIYFTPDIKTGF